MYTALLHTHNMFRWLVLLALLVSILLAFSGWFGKREWSKADRISGLLLTIFMDLQFLVGVILYVFVSPITKAAFNDFSAAMQNADLRFYAVEHISLMIVALVLVHIGRARSKRVENSWKKHRVAAVFYTVSLLIILSAIPWNRALI